MNISLPVHGTVSVPGLPSPAHGGVAASLEVPQLHWPGQARREERGESATPTPEREREICVSVISSLPSEN